MALTAALAQAAAASESTFCQTDRLPLTQSPLADKREFTCGNGMSGTMPELTKKGWSVVAIHVREETSSWHQSFLVLKKD